MRISDWSSDVCSSDLPEAVSPAVLALVADEAPNRVVLCAGAGSFEQARIGMTEGVFIGRKDEAAEEILARLTDLQDPATMHWAASSGGQGELELRKAGRSEEHTSELQSLMRISYAVFCL